LKRFALEEVMRKSELSEAILATEENPEFGGEESVNGLFQDFPE
jgi:hypothetical protein